MTGRRIAWLIIAATLIVAACTALIIGLTEDGKTHTRSAKFVNGYTTNKSGAAETDYIKTAAGRQA